MKKTSALIFSVLTKMAMPKNFSLIMLVVPLLVGFVMPGTITTCDVGSTGGGCTGG
jgi:hypothetical protein